MSWKRSITNIIALPRRTLIHADFDPTSRSWRSCRLLRALLISCFLLGGVQSGVIAEEGINTGKLCDQTASDVEDGSVGSGGLWDYQVKADTAVDACAAALRDINSASPRWHYQYGRALYLSGATQGAIRQLRIAANMDYARAFSRLAEIAETSQTKLELEYNLELDPVQLNTRAANLGDRAGMLDLAARRLLLSSDPAERDRNKKIIAELARRKFPVAMVIQGRLDKSGKNLPEDIALYREAAETGYLPAMIITGMPLTIPGQQSADFQQGMMWLRKAADAGDRSSQLQLAEFCVRVESPSCGK